MEQTHNNAIASSSDAASQTDFAEVLEVAAKAGHILLENGAEISRVEDIMSRISSHFGVDSGNFFVLSNGIFTTGRANKITKSGAQASTYANVEFIPLRGIQLSKVVAVNRLSYDISNGRTTLAEARERLERIASAAQKPAWEQILGSGFGAGGFCAVFGGGWMDCFAALVVGLLLYAFVLGVSGRYLSKIVGGTCNALVATLLCILCWRMDFGGSLANIIIGAIMPLIPGVPFVNGVRDLANSDYIAGFTRLSACRIHRHSGVCTALWHRPRALCAGRCHWRHRVGSLPAPRAQLRRHTRCRHAGIVHAGVHPLAHGSHPLPHPSTGIPAVWHLPTRSRCWNILVHLLSHRLTVRPLDAERMDSEQNRHRHSPGHHPGNGAATAPLLPQPPHTLEIAPPRDTGGCCKTIQTTDFSD